MKKLYLMTLLVSLITTGVFAQSKFFLTAKTSELTNARPLTKTIKNISVFKLDEAAMRTYLQNAPMEFKNNNVTIPLEIPMPNGTVEIFNMVESPTLSPAIASQNPDIKTYSGNGTKDKKSVIRLSLTSSGFNAVILNVGNETVYFESYSTERNNIYFNYFTKDVVVPNGPKKSSCQLDPNDLAKEIPGNHNSHRSAASSVGSQLTTFRLAMAANAEFVAHNGGTQASGFAAVVAYVNRIKAFYRNELAVDFTLVSGTNLVYSNAATDPYTNDDQVAMLNENLNNCNTVIGVANYDIGHVWGYVGGSGGGIASPQSVCNDSRKGRGVSGEGDLTTYSQVFMDQLVFHEMGHQFGMSHSYNSSIPVCTTRSADTSVEPGSGATIMSYGFTCGTDNYFTSQQTGPILQFHTANYEQAIAYMATISCGVLTITGNTAPVVTVPSNYTIPKSTPFALTGSATDANSDSLSYCWEGTNIGTITPVVGTLADTTQPPFFRSYQLSSSPTRVYPLLARILDGSNYSVGDKLPSISIVTTHRLTVRDNNANGGGVSNASVTVTVDGSIGPFLETTNLSDVYDGLSTLIITWSVNGTNTATPTVNILLSTDGGLTWLPTPLAAATPNDGSQLVTLPNVDTQTARIKVEAVGNIFFDISNVNFSIRRLLNLTAIAGINGTISSSGATTVASGANLSYTITPDPCYQVADVLVDGVSQGPITTYTFTNVTTAHTISVTFTKLTYIIMPALLNATIGYISPPSTDEFDCGTSSTYTIIAQAGYIIADVLVDGVSVGAVGTYTFSNITANHTISATFIEGSTFNITASAGANGSISSIGTTAVASGANKSYTITANSCYQIADVTVDGVSQGAISTYIFTNVTAAHTINATFVSSATTNGNLTTTANNTYTWSAPLGNGQTYTVSGTYTSVTTNAAGCPNTATLTLTINIIGGTTWYRDADGDGFGTAAVSVNAPTAPTGYVANDTDCNDANASVNPNASEIIGNSMDDNCNGIIDEVSPTSYLLAQSCNVILSNIQSSLFCDPLLSAFAQLGSIQGFRFKVTNGAIVRTYDTTVNSFNLTQLPGGVTLGTTYTIQVSAKSGGFWRAYGASCTVTTPSSPRATYVSNPTCGSTLTDLSQSIFCETRPDASGYRFRVRNGATLVGTVDKTVNRFSLLDLGISNVAFGTTYTIDVLLAFGGTFRPDTEYGSTCSITTPAAPGSSRVIQPTCGSTINNLWTSIFAQQVTGAQGYKFVVTNGVQTREYTTSNARFQLPLLSGGAAANTVYTIRVDVLYASSYVQGTVWCTITTSPTATRQTSAALAIYDVKAYPNPYADTFALDVNTSSEDKVGVRVYDMLGREVEARQATVDAITNLEIGSQYPSGVYNIIVTQGNNVKSLRVIKR